MIKVKKLSSDPREKLDSETKDRENFQENNFHADYDLLSLWRNVPSKADVSSAPVDVIIPVAVAEVSVTRGHPLRGTKIMTLLFPAVADKTRAPFKLLLVTYAGSNARILRILELHSVFTRTFPFIFNFVFSLILVFFKESSFVTLYVVNKRSFAK